MRSTSGEHYIALDQIRAIAAFMVFAWHFTHGFAGSPVPFEFPVLWGPLALFDEGHVGVALFMTLSGYLFAKLLDGKVVAYRYFLWNRFLRLAPLLILIFVIHIVRNLDHGNFWLSALQQGRYIAEGFIYPTWPNGGWSIAVELHFYLLLPILLYLRKQWSPALWAIIAIAILTRLFLHLQRGEVQSISYWTIVGRIDQFILGIIAFHGRELIKKRHYLAIFIGASFCTLYGWFDAAGGFFGRPAYPSPSRLWIILPTIEAIAFGSLIAWYDTSFEHTRGRFSRLMTKLGEYSYSIYLLHVFFVFSLAEWIHKNVVDISNFYVALPVAAIIFVFLLPMGYLSMRFIERPFLSFRRPYYVQSDLQKPNNPSSPIDAELA